MKASRIKNIPPPPTRSLLRLLPRGCGDTPAWRGTNERRFRAVETWLTDQQFHGLCAQGSARRCPLIGPWVLEERLVHVFDAPQARGSCARSHQRMNGVMSTFFPHRDRSLSLTTVRLLWGSVARPMSASADEPSPRWTHRLQDIVEKACQT